MHYPRHNHFAKFPMLLAGLGMAAIAVLWSWNTLAELLGGPTAQFKHVVATTILIVTVRYALSRRSSRHKNHHRRPTANGASE